MASEELPAPWASSPKETEQCRQIFEKYKAKTGFMERQQFEDIIQTLVGNAAAGRKRREQRSVAWFTNKTQGKDAIEFIPFLKVLTSSGVTVKMLSQSFDSIMEDKAKDEPLKCPSCNTNLPPNYTLKKENEDGEEKADENVHLLRKLEDIERRRASLREDAKRKSINIEELDRRYSEYQQQQQQQSTPPVSPARLDPRLHRLRVEDLETVAQSLEQLEAAGFSEVGDVGGLLQSVKRMQKPGNSPNCAALDPEGANGGSGDPKDISQENSTASLSPNPPAPSTSLPPTPSTGKRASKAAITPGGAVRQSSASRRSTRAGSAASQGSPMKLPTNNSGGGGPSPTKRASVASGLGSASRPGSSQNLRSSSRSVDLGSSQSMASMVLPEPLPSPLPIPDGLVKREDLAAAVLRRTDKLIEAVRRSDTKMAKQWVEGGEPNVFVDGKTTLLHIAIESRKQASLEILKLIATPHNLIAFNEYGDTPLHTAARCLAAEKIRVLKECGAQYDTVDARGESPLHLAAKHPGGAATVQALIDCGANVLAGDETGQTALHVAASADVVQALLDGGARSETVDTQNNTALHTIMSREIFDHAPDHPAIKRLATPAALAAKNNSGCTALHIVVERGAPRLAETLALCGGDPEVENGLMQSAMHLARRRWQQEAGNHSQLNWSALLVSWGVSVQHLQGVKGVAWHLRDPVGWTHIEGLQEEVESVFQRRVEAGAQLDWCVPGNDTGPWAWAATVKRIFQPDRGSWTEVSVDFPTDTRGAGGDRLEMRLKTDQDVQVVSELRRLPVV